MKTINFKINGNHESHSGQAVVLDFVTSGINSAAKHFGFENANLVKRNSIGRVTVEDVEYSIFENYIDSGSEDYYYFAVEVIE
jgi:hypothetical protein